MARLLSGLKTLNFGIIAGVYDTSKDLVESGQPSCESKFTCQFVDALVWRAFGRGEKSPELGPVQVLESPHRVDLDPSLHVGRVRSKKVKWKISIQLDRVSVRFSECST